MFKILIEISDPVQIAVSATIIVSALMTIRKAMDRNTTRISVAKWFGGTESWQSREIHLPIRNGLAGPPDQNPQEFNKVLSASEASNLPSE